MLRGTFKEIVLQVLNIGLGIGAILVMARGFYINDGLAGLGLALFMTSAICFVGFRFGIEQRLREERAGAKPLNTVTSIRSRVPTTFDPTG